MSEPTPAPEPLDAGTAIIPKVSLPIPGEKPSDEAWEAARWGPLFTLDCPAAACVIRGRIVKRARVNVWDSGLRAYAIDLEADPQGMKNCTLPAKASAMRDSSRPRVSTRAVHHLEVHGVTTPRLDAALSVGQSLCGYAIQVHEGGSRDGGAMPPFTEGALYDGENALVAAWSYLFTTSSVALAKHWSFVREGIPSFDGSGTAHSVTYPPMTVAFDGSKAPVFVDRDNVLMTPKGELRVRVNLLYWERFDGYRFSAVR